MQCWFGEVQACTRVILWSCGHGTVDSHAEDTVFLYCLPFHDYQISVEGTQMYNFTWRWR